MQWCVVVIVSVVDRAHFVLKQHFSNLKMTAQNCRKEGSVPRFVGNIEQLGISLCIFLITNVEVFRAQ